MWKIVWFENGRELSFNTLTNKKFKKWLSIWGPNEIYYDSSGDVMISWMAWDSKRKYSAQCYPIVGKYGI